MTDKIYYQTGVVRPEDFHLHLRLLNEAERQRALRYQHQPDKLRFACTRIALKRLLAQCADTAPEHIQIQTTPQGQPFCEHDGIRWQISVSHCDLHYLIAVSSARIMIGTDLEAYDQHRVFERDLLTSFCHPQEISALNILPQAQRNVAAQSLWSAKEALLKAAGTGFRRDPCTILLPLALPIPVSQQCHLMLDDQQIQLTQHILMPQENPLLITFCASDPDAEWLLVAGQTKTGSLPAS